MSDERDRRAAEEWLDANDGPAVPPRSAVDSLAAFRAAARAALARKEPDHAR